MLVHCIVSISSIRWKPFKHMWCGRNAYSKLLAMVSAGIEFQIELQRKILIARRKAINPAAAAATAKKITACCPFG